MNDGSRTPENAPIIDKKLSRDEIEMYLSMASTRKLGIWYDKNAIIVWLCRQLLELLDQRDE